MPRHFQKHYTRAEARALLPQVRQWLRRLSELRTGLEKHEKELTRTMAPGLDTGGPVVNAWVRTMAELHEILLEFHRRQIQVKDLDRGLIDFPALRGGEEVFLCWEDGEEDVEFWHDLEAGYAGRQRLDDDD